MKTLVLCRHGKSDWPANVEDINRPLKSRGIKDAARLGKLLNSHDFKADLIVSSPANRAHSTAKLIAEHIGYQEDAIRVDKSVYFEGMGSLLEVISRLPGTASTVMIFGHNPTMEQTVRHLAKMNSPFSMPTLGMACFEGYTQEWSKFQDQYTYLRWLQTPRLVREE